MAGEVGDLQLPVARVDDRPRREEEHCRLALPVDLVEDAHAVALDVALVVRVTGPGLLGAVPRRVTSAPSQPSIQSSSSRCPLSTPERRSRMIPSLKVATSVTSASREMGTP